MAKVSVTNINVNVNNFAPAYKSVGLGAIPAGVNVSTVVKTIEKQLFKDLKTNWPASYADFDSSQEDSAIMAPWKDNVPGTAPKCVTDAITLDFQNWGLPVDKPTITNMAKEITQQISNNGGLSGTFYGKMQVAGSETIYYGIGFATAVVVNNPEEKGIIYVFSSSLGLN